MWNCSPESVPGRGTGSSESSWQPTFCYCEQSPGVPWESGAELVHKSQTSRFTSNSSWSLSCNYMPQSHQCFLKSWIALAFSKNQTIIHPFYFFWDLWYRRAFDGSNKGYHWAHLAPGTHPSCQRDAAGLSQFWSYWEDSHSCGSSSWRWVGSKEWFSLLVGF